MDSSNKKAVLITGATRGIGYGIAECLAREGCRLALCGMREENAVTKELDHLRSLGGEILYCQADVGNACARQRMLDKIKDRFGALHVLINNAGVAPQARVDILEATEESFERLIHTNLQGPYFLTQSTARWMIEQRKNNPACPMCVINISSVSATTPSTSRGDYCISKAGVSMATRLWAARLAEFNIPVYEIRPGLIATDMTAAVRTAYDQRIKEGLLPQARWGTPADVGRAAAMLVRGDLAYSTGQVLMVDGGLTIPRL
ncbi:MAG: 3-ketoacyl-ACP reductase [Verrucomicrobiae bacterium]|nr:3-ketoacyl-ACP reductase [Verrucomicrobiae bacterium]